MEIVDLKRLAGIGQPSQFAQAVSQSIDRAAIMREQNIKPGTDAWFRLWFTKPHLTGEKPY